MKAPSDQLPFPENLIEQAHRDVDEERARKNLPPIDWDARGKELMERRNQNRVSRRSAVLKRLAAAAGKLIG